MEDNKKFMNLTLEAFFNGILRLGISFEMWRMLEVRFWGFDGSTVRLSLGGLTFDMAKERFDWFGMKLGFSSFSFTEFFRFRFFSKFPEIFWDMKSPNSFSWAISEL